MSWNSGLTNRQHNHYKKGPFTREGLFKLSLPRALRSSTRQGELKWGCTSSISWNKTPYNVTYSPILRGEKGRLINIKIAHRKSILYFKSLDYASHIGPDTQA